MAVKDHWPGRVPSLSRRVAVRRFIPADPQGVASYLDHPDPYSVDAYRKNEWRQVDPEPPDEVWWAREGQAILGRLGYAAEAGGLGGNRSVWVRR